MDQQFLKFWGDAIRQTSVMQTLGEEISRWMKGDIKETDELYAFFRKHYGLDQGTDAFTDYESRLKEMAVNFQKSFHELLSMLGVVPRSEYDQLLGQYAELKQKLAGLEENLKMMEKRFAGNASDQPKAAGVFDEMIKAQTGQFQKVMNTFAEISGIKTPEHEKK
jgi:BMFP domain-containing protein YqiC